MTSKSVEEYRAAAERAREDASNASFPDVKEALVQLAARYDALAEFAAKRQKAEKPEASD